MSTPIVVRPQRLAPAAVAGATAALGCGVLAARPALLAFAPNPTGALVVLFGALLAIGIIVPLPHDRRRVTHAAQFAPAALIVGMFAFGTGRVIVGGSAPARFALPIVLANSLAAVAEEAWFRRLCYGLLAPAGPTVAVIGTTVLFAAVHVAMYGWWVVPLDLAAGALFGWQRAVSGSWTVSAATHVLANLLIVL
jgi:hypothetical protein